jgi:hypothetical protein
MTTFTIVHVVLSLVGIISGIVVATGLLSSKQLDGWTILFLISTFLTSATGFGFPVDRLLPSHVVGAISIVVLAVAFYARYPRLMAGGWRSIYVLTAIAALYLNVFVLVVQLFLKVPVLNALAPTQSEPPFAIAQLVVLIAFVVLGIATVKRFRRRLPSVRPIAL